MCKLFTFPKWGWEWGRQLGWGFHEDSDEDEDEDKDNNYNNKIKKQKIGFDEKPKIYEEEDLGFKELTKNMKKLNISHPKNRVTFFLFFLYI